MRMPDPGPGSSAAEPYPPERACRTTGSTMSTSSPATTVEERYQSVLEAFRAAGQEHVFRFWNELDEDQRERLVDQAEKIDLELVRQLRTGEMVIPGASPLRDREPIDVLQLGRAPKSCTRKDALYRGIHLLENGKVGVFLVAGGQASRLGIEGPKGCLPVGPLSGRTLFELHAAKIWKLREKYGAPVPWYIMTNAENDAATRAYFERHEHFGLPPEDILFLPQSMLPALDEDGHMLLTAKDRIFENPNGHGGAYRAFADHGGLDDARQRGLEHIFYFQVDNPLVRIPDPIFTGFHDALESEMSLKVVRKTGPYEKLGVVALENGKPTVIEYSDLSAEEAELRDEEDEELVFWAGSIAIHLFRLDFIERITAQGPRLLYHVAEKDVDTIDEGGEPTTRTARKYETFVFDALPMARSWCNFEVVRHREFAPIKNPEGVDSLESAQKLLMEEHRRWLQQVDIEVKGRVEISPHAAITWGDLRGHLEKWKGRIIDGNARVERQDDGTLTLEVTRE